MNLSKLIFMKRINLWLLVCVFAATSMVSCKDKEEEEKGCITGTVTFFNTGSVTDAYVQLLLLEKNEVVYSGVINEMGCYTIDNIIPASYRFRVYKKGFVDTVFSETVQILSTEKNQGECWGLDWTIMKLPPRLSIVDNNGESVDSLNYGSAVDDVARSFNIFNDASHTLHWEITKTAAWISSISRDSGELRPGGTQAVIVAIDRDKLQSGMNETTLHITSDAGSKELKVTAVGEQRRYPVLNTLAVTDIKANSAIFNGVLVNEGIPDYTERGFVYGLSSMPILENTISKLTVAVTDDTLFQATVMDLEETKTYYVRAYAINKRGVSYSTNEERFQPHKLLPTVMTDGVFDKDLTNRSVAVKGTIKELGDPVYSKRGFVYGTAHNPMLEDAIIKEVRGDGIGTYVANLTDLEIGKIYYVRAYVENAAGVFYGSEVELDFNAVAPQIETRAVTGLNRSNGTATMNASIVEYGDPKYKKKGFVYGLWHNPMIEDEGVDIKVVAGRETGIYLSNLSDLEMGKVYYIRAYAENEAGVVYGSEVELDFRPVSPQIETRAVTGINRSNGTATLNASIVECGDPKYSEKGFVYGLVHNPTLEDGEVKKRIVSGREAGDYFSNLSDLEINNVYYIRPYVENEAGVSYGAEIELDFNAIEPEIVTKVSDVTGNSAVFHVLVQSVGMPAYTECGFVYGTIPNPTLNDETTVKETVAGVGNGDYIKKISGLQEGETYYVRAYARNEYYVAYGDVVSFDAVTLEYVVLPEIGLMVQKFDLGQGDWPSARLMCATSSVGGFSDWRLPEIEELMALYNKRDKIGGFIEGKYWALSTYKENYTQYYFLIDFSDGHAYKTNVTQSLYGIRAVRTITEE